MKRIEKKLNKIKAAADFIFENLKGTQETVNYGDAYLSLQYLPNLKGVKKLDLERLEKLLANRQNLLELLEKSGEAIVFSQCRGTAINIKTDALDYCIYISFNLDFLNRILPKITVETSSAMDANDLRERQVSVFSSMGKNEKMVLFRQILEADLAEVQERIDWLNEEVD